MSSYNCSGVPHYLEENKYSTHVCLFLENTEKRDLSELGEDQPIAIGSVVLP